MHILYTCLLWFFLVQLHQVLPFYTFVNESILPTDGEALLTLHLLHNLIIRVNYQHGKSVLLHRHFTLESRKR